METGPSWAGYVEVQNGMLMITNKAKKNKKTKKTHKKERRHTMLFQLVYTPSI